MTESNFTWQELDKDIDIYKFYLDMVIKSAIFVFGITGGVATFYFANIDKSFMKYSLLFPVFLNGGFFALFASSIKFAEILNDNHKNSCKKAGVKIAYELSALPNVLKLFSIMYGLSALGLLVLFCINLPEK